MFKSFPSSSRTAAAQVARLVVPGPAAAAPGAGSLQFPALTGVRALGAMAVFFVHLPLNLGVRLVIDVMAFFFVLSGFLITYLYYNRLPGNAGRLRAYFVNRFARIYPIYFLLVTVAILLRHDFRLLYLFKNYSLTHALFFNRADRAIEPSWSLTVEECFYALAPLFLGIVRRYRFAASLLAAALLLGIALWISGLPISFLHTARFVFTTTFFGHFFEFFCGIYLALVVLRRKAAGSLDIQGRRYTQAGAAGIIASMGWLVLSNNMNDPSRPLPFLLVNNFVLPVAVALWYYGLICERSRSARALSLPLLQATGRSSYAFYLLHMLVIEALAVPLLQPLFGEQRNLYVLTVFLLIQVLAWLLYRYYEEPLNRAIRGRKPSAAASRVRHQP